MNTVGGFVLTITDGTSKSATVSAASPSERITAGLIP